MKQYLFKICVIICLVGGLASCTNNEPAKIKLSENQQSTIIAYANQANGKISFTASADWSARISSQSRANEIDWINLSQTSGSAGENIISFSLSVNGTGATRTAYILIECEDELLSLQVQQTAEAGNTEDEPSLPHPLSGYILNMERLFPQYLLVDWDGNLLYYNSMYLIEKIKGNLGTAEIRWNYPTIDVIATTGETYKIEVNNDYLAKHIEIVHNDGDVTTYDLEYSGGYLTKCTQYHGGEIYETSEVMWESGDVVSVKNTYNGGTTDVSFVYTNIENTAGIMEYDLQFLVDLDQCAVFYYCGLLGRPAAHLLKSFSAVEKDGTFTYTISADYDYVLDSKNRPTKIHYTESESESSRGRGFGCIDFAWTDR